jgi:hypothetical protein
MFCPSMLAFNRIITYYSVVGLEINWNLESKEEPKKKNP